jgi:hypothetical protein
VHRASSGTKGLGLPSAYPGPYSAVLRLLRIDATYVDRVNSPVQHERLFQAIRCGDLGPVKLEAVVLEEQVNEVHEGESK